MNRKTGGLLYGKAFHYIDHLAPLCALLQIPLLVTEEEVEEVIARFYPDVETLLVDYAFLPSLIMEHFSTLLISTPRALFDEVFAPFELLYRKKIRTIWCPHGNSDKGHLVPHMEALAKETHALVYGEKMLDFLKQKNAFFPSHTYVKVGNFRKDYFLKHETFYRDLLAKHLTLPAAEKNLLYIPTWSDAEGSSSFYDALPLLLAGLPSSWNLLIKPHPNLLVEGRGYEELLTNKKPNVLFLPSFPPVYPLLALADVYLGDFSSINYDCLSFDKPMIFFNQGGRALDDPGLHIHRCGISLEPENYVKVFYHLQSPLTLSPLRQSLYDYTFEKDLSPKQVKEAIEACYAS